MDQLKQLLYLASLKFLLARFKCGLFRKTFVFLLECLLLKHCSRGTKSIVFAVPWFDLLTRWSLCFICYSKLPEFLHFSHFHPTFKTKQTTSKIPKLYRLNRSFGSTIPASLVRKIRNKSLNLQIINWQDCKGTFLMPYFLVMFTYTFLHY